MSNAFKSKSKSTAPAHLIHDILDRLKMQYLPDLRKLRDECTWLQSSLGLEEKDAQELQTSETRLVQFVGMVDLVINKITLLEKEDPNNVNYSKLDFLEANIVKSILPVRARLHEKWKENERSRAVQQSNIAQKVSQPSAAAGAGGDHSTHKRAAAAQSAAESNAVCTGQGGRAGKASVPRSQPSSRATMGSTTGSSNGSNSGSASASSSNNIKPSSSGRVPPKGFQAATLPDFAPARSAESSNLGTAFCRDASAVYWEPSGTTDVPVSDKPQVPLSDSFMHSVSSNPKVSALSRGLLRAGMPTAETVNTAPSAHIGLSAPHRSVLSVGNGPDGQVSYSSGSNYSGFRGVTSRPGTASNQSVQASMMGSLPFSPLNISNADSGGAKPDLPRAGSSNSLRGIKQARTHRTRRGPGSTASAASSSSAGTSRSMSAMHLSTATATATSSAQVDDDCGSHDSHNNTSYSRASLSSNAAALAVATDGSPDAEDARKQAKNAASSEAAAAVTGAHSTKGAGEEADVGMELEMEEDALTASIFDDGCESISDLGIYDHAHNADEFELLPRRADSLSTVPVGWRLHNESYREPDAKPYKTSKSSSSGAGSAMEAHTAVAGRSLKRPFGAVTPALQSAYLTGGTNPARGASRRKDESKLSRKPSGTGLGFRADGTGAEMGGGGDTSSVAGCTAEDVGVLSARQRRKLSAIVPYPRRPRPADYHCSVCCEPYQVMVADNPWWAVYTHRCPHCHILQVPRIDITAPSNAVELDPNVAALYGDGLSESSDGAYSSDSGEGEEGGWEESADAMICAETTEEGSAQNGKPRRQSGNRTSAATMEADPQVEEVRRKSQRCRGSSAAEPGRDPARGPGSQADSAVGDSERAERAAEALEREEQSKLLVLMCHARTCTGAHSSDKHAEICKSTKFLMLHIRDCRGLDAQGQECAFPWCRPCKKMLKHLTQCFQPSTCTICSPWGLPPPFQQLRQLQQIPFCPPSTASSTAAVASAASSAVTSGAGAAANQANHMDMRPPWHGTNRPT